jgi:hypothetical protein
VRKQVVKLQISNNKLQTIYNAQKQKPFIVGQYNHFMPKLPLILTGLPDLEYGIF